MPAGKGLRAKRYGFLPVKAAGPCGPQQEGDDALSLKIVFMGTPQFSVPVLERILQDGHEVAAVYTQPDKPVGRGYKVAMPPVKAFAAERGLSVRQPVKMRDGAVAAELRSLAPDLAVVVAYGRLLPPDILEAPRMGCINLHASLLPRWRGAAPIQWSILAGDAETGVTSMYMARDIDTGDIILQEKTAIGPDETAPQLTKRLSVMGAACISDTLSLFESGRVVRRPQEDAASTHASMLNREMGQVDFARPAGELHNLVRGLADWPCAFTRFSGKVLKIRRSALHPLLGGVPGEVLDAKKLIVACGEGALELCEVQLEGKQAMEGALFMRGQRIKAHDQFMNR